MIKIYGVNSVRESLRAKAKIKEAFILIDHEKKYENIITILKERKINYTLKDKNFFNNSFGKKHQGIALIREDYQTYDLTYLEKINKENKRILILDGIEDPQNLGAILRSADAFSFDAIILGNNHSTPITEVVANVSTGAIEYVPIIYVNSLIKALTYLKENGYWVVATDAKGDTLAENISKDRNLAIIIGSEGFGISKTLIKLSDYLLKIPMSGHVNSLNASVSAAILMYLFKN